MESDEEGFPQTDISFYEDNFTHFNCAGRKATPFPLSAKMESRRLYALSEIKIPVWSVDKDDDGWEDSSTESEQAIKPTIVRLKGNLNVALAELPGYDVVYMA